MAKLSLTVPIVGQKRTTAEPAVDTALSAIETWANGNVGIENLENKGVTLEKLSTAVQTTLGEKTAGGVMKKAAIATEESRESEVYGTLTTPDEVEVTVVENGLIAVWYQATWKNTFNKFSTAAIFVGANQLKIAKGKANPEAQESKVAGNTFAALATSSAGLGEYTSSEAYAGDVTTGQVLGAGTLGGPVYIFGLAAGAYKISVRFKADVGSKVTVKKRVLRALAFA